MPRTVPDSNAEHRLSHGLSLRQTIAVPLDFFSFNFVHLLFFLKIVKKNNSFCTFILAVLGLLAAWAFL